MLRKGRRTSTSGAATAPRWRSRKPTFVVKAEASVRASPSSSIATAIPACGVLIGPRSEKRPSGGARAARAPALNRESLAVLLRTVDLDLLLGHGVEHLALLLDGLLFEGGGAASAPPACQC